uniref:U2** protein n=1 Tax=Pea yellow stunt virus TaxID=1436892 RepID=V9VDF7_9VIRU|nr:U2** protein [Pea yellow stunt virus]
MTDADCRVKVIPSDVVRLKEEQDAFWVSYQNYLRSSEDMLGEFCRYHGRRVSAYPKLPNHAPTRWLLKTKTIYDIRVKDCSLCCEEQTMKVVQKTEAYEALRDLYDFGNYRFQVYYTPRCKLDVIYE